MESEGTAAARVLDDPMAGPAASSGNGWSWAGLLGAAVLLGTIVRVVPHLAASGPVGDGGLFALMTQEIRAADFALPLFTEYNNDQLPFAYPPLAFYVAALLAAAGIDVDSLLRMLPVLFSIATIPAVFLVARELDGSPRFAALVALVFAIIPRGYEWLIIGGGLPRGLGLLLALLTVWQGLRLARDRRARSVALTGTFGGLTLLTHPEAALFACVSLAVVVLFKGREIGIIARLAVAAGVAIIIAAPWLIAIIDRHGLETLTSAAGSRADLLLAALRDLLFGHFTGAVAFDLFLGIGFLGLLLEVGRGSYLAPVWFLAAIVIILGAGFTFAVLPWSLLIAVAVRDFIISSAPIARPVSRWARPVMVSGLVGAAMLASLATGYSESSMLHSVSQDNRAAMRWVSQNLPPEAHVVVITGRPWWNDLTSEWFPALAERHSLATAQGYEWTDRFLEQRVRHGSLQFACEDGAGDCVDRWATHFDVRVDFAYLPKQRLAGPFSPSDCCRALRASLSQQHRVVFDGPGATIIELMRQP